MSNIFKQFISTQIFADMLHVLHAQNKHFGLDLVNIIKCHIKATRS